MDSQKSSGPSWKESSCFTFALDSQRKRKRAKFDPSRKSEVATVRKKGACLRCRLLKASCSEARPCENCMRAKLSSHVQVHKWMSCVSVALRDVNIFKKALPSPALAQDHDASSLDSLAEMPLCLCGENQIVWSLDWVTGHITGWVQDRNSLGFSRTGMLASPRLQGLLEPFLGPEVAGSLRLLMLSTMLVYNLGHEGGLPAVNKHREAFYLTRATSAEKVLRYLEETVTAPYLIRAGGDHQRLQALIVLAFGAMRALAYYDDSEVRKRFEGQPDNPKPPCNAKEMRDQLAGTLGHFLILLIEKLGTACLRDKLPLILDNVQRHTAKPFITPLPIRSGPLTEINDLASTPMADAPEAPYDGSTDDWLRSTEMVGPEFDDSPCIFDPGDDLQRILSNDLDAIDEWNTPRSSKIAMPFRQCLVCSSPLCSDEPDALCIACQQPPDEVWPGKKTLESNESSPVTCESSRGILSGQNSLSTSLTSQDSVFDEMMAMRDRPRAARATLPTPVEEEEDDPWIFDAEDMEFTTGPVVPENDAEFPSGWSLYWDDSCDEQSVRDELESCSL